VRFTSEVDSELTLTHVPSDLVKITLQFIFLIIEVRKIKPDCLENSYFILAFFFGKSAFPVLI
jgi:hypothetical protein